MSKSKITYVGIDVAAKTLALACTDGKNWCEAEFNNTPEGHKALLHYLRKRAQSARVCIEATGIYHLELAIALANSPFCEVMVVNPRVSKNFARALNTRAKTDRVDARMLAIFSERMPFTPWQPPAPSFLELRAITRRIDTLTRQAAAEKNRSHVAIGKIVANDIKVNIHHLERRIEMLTKHALAIIEANNALHSSFTLLTTIKGIAETSAIRILGEVCLLPDDMTGKQWVAHAGLDPRPYESGTSVHKSARISKTGNAHLRRALYMPALATARFDIGAKSFRDALVERGLKPVQAIVAIMRKLLLAIRAILKSGQAWQSERFLQAAKHV